MRQCHPRPTHSVEAPPIIRRGLSQEKPNGAVLGAIFSVLAAMLALLGVKSMPAKAAEATEQLVFYTDDDNGIYFSVGGGETAYCMDPDVPGPGKAGTTYTRLERATGVIAYIAYHGYPNNLTIGGASFPDTTIGTKNARATTNMAIWTYQRDHSRTTVTDLALDWMNEAASKLLADAQAWAKSSANTADAPENNSTWVYAPPSGSGKQRMLLPGKAEEKGSLSLTKSSTQPAFSKDNACYSLAGATYEVFSDQDLTKAVGTLTTKDDGATNVLKGLAAGTYYAKETKTPIGYALNKTVYPVEVKPGSTSVILATDEPLSCRVDALLEKVDAETGQAAPQGDASLENAEFSVAYWDNLEGSTEGSPMRSWVFRTDAQGKVLLDESHLVSGDALFTDAEGRPVLPIGTISISETAAPTGYSISDAGVQTQVLKAGDGKITQAFVTAKFREKVKRGGVVVGKISRETADYLAQGQSSLEGATFSITLLSPGSVVVGGQTYTTGQTVAQMTTAQEGDAFVARTASDELPFATYLIKESATSPSSGTLPNSEWEQTVEIREDNAYVDLTDTQEACPNQVVRGDFSFTKRNGATAEAMAGIPFALSSISTGETHIIVTDENGMFDSSLFPHSNMTNASDIAMTPDGSVDETLLSPEAGVWFSGREDLVVETNDSLGALPFDSYTLRELPCAANEGMQLVEVNLAVRRNAYTLDWGTIDNQLVQKVSLATELVGTTGTHEMSCTGTNLIDTVFYDGLSVGEQYVLVGTLHMRLSDGSDGGVLTDSEGNPCSQTKAFTARFTSGHEELSFAVDATSIAGQTVVCFEELYVGSPEGEPIVSHADIASADQSVSIVGIGTKAQNAADGTQELGAFQTAEVIDHVSYTGLSAGESYVISGSLHLRAQDGSDLGPLSDDRGNTITAVQEFVPETSDGEVSITFSFDASEFGGCTLVAFEQLCDVLGNVIASHEDISDEGQTIRIPVIQTSAQERINDSQKERTADTHTIVDTVTYRNLTPGAAYVLTANLHGRAEDGSDQGVVTTSGGEPVTARQSFVCEQADGEIEVLLELDDASLSSPAVVVFEVLARESDGETVAAHEDITDAGQTVWFPKITTTLTDAEDNDHSVSQGTITVVDEVSYRGLVTGTEYRVEGTIHVRNQDGTDAGPFKDASGKMVSAEQFFVTEASEGTVKLTFSFDSALLENKPAVAFEVLYQGDTRIASHEDITSQSQTVTPSPKPVQPSTTTQKDENVIRMPQTGRFPVAYLLTAGGFVVALAAMILLAWQKRRTQTGPRPHRRRHYVR